MKPSLALRRLLLASTLLAAANTAQAQLYWDTNGTTAGFGPAPGTWADPTLSLWSTSDDGTGTPEASLTTLTSDSLNFGTVIDGLGAGTINVGTVDSGDITFGAASGAITLAGGTLNFDAASTITVDNTTNSISSAISGAATSLTKAGTGTLVLSGGGTMAGDLIISAGTVQLGANNGVFTSAGLDIAADAPASATFDLNSYDQTLSRFGFSAVNKDGSLTITGGVNSTLTIDAMANSLIGQSGTDANPINPARTVNVDMSGLGELVWDGGSDYYFEVGPRGKNKAGGEFDPGTATVLLADSNSITGTQLRVGANGMNNHGGTSVLRLGQTNVLNADTINIGASSRSNATLDFRDGLTGTPTVTIRGTDGASAVTTWDVGKVAAVYSTKTWTSTVDLTSGELDAFATSLRIGIANASSTIRTGVEEATFTMGKGTLDVTTLIVGTIIGSGSHNTLYPFGGNGTFTLNNGTVTAENVYLAEKTIT